VAEPAGNQAAAAHPAPAGAEFGADRAARDRELRRAPPVINWSVEDLPAGSAAPPPEPPPLEPPAGEPRLPEPPPLTVAWPPENQRSIVTLRILPAGAERLPGRAVRLGLTACGFRHGQFDIYHLPAEDGRVVLSAASLVRPGVFDPASMDQQRFPGVNLFAVLPGPLNAEATLQRLGQVAIELAGRVGGCVQDENSAPFSTADAGSWRRRRLDAMGAAGGGAAGRAD
jgi:FtsZ-interacting cell division protein ZipA